MAGTDCAVCKLIRTYLLFAVPLLALVGLKTADGDGSVKLWFARAELIDVLAWGALLALVVITLYRVYEEYYLPRRRMDKLQKIRSQLASDDFDEVDNDDERSRRSESSETVEHDG
ncbi:MAG TPA: hypothetical protein DEF79_02380 [Gammaproteobacteria bacterium]|nr:hypothetical protein [Gammaproteobacteria bacterium]